MDWNSFSCNDCQNFGQGSFSNSFEYSSPCACPDFDCDSNSLASCDLSWNGSEKQLPRLKSKKAVPAPAFQFADHPFVSTTKGVKLKFNKPRQLNIKPKAKPKGTVSSSALADKNLTNEEKKVEKFLRSNPAFLNSFVKKYVDQQTVSEWSKKNEKQPEGDRDAALALEKKKAEGTAELQEDVSVTENLENTEASDEMGAELTKDGEDLGENETEMAEEEEDLGQDETELDSNEKEQEEHIDEEDTEVEVGEATEELKPEESHDLKSEEMHEVNESEEMPDELKQEEESKDPIMPENTLTTSTSTEDATLTSADLSVPPFLVSASTSTTDGLILPKPPIANPKVLANLGKLTKMREARAKQKECEAAKARDAELALEQQRQLNRLEAKKQKLLAAKNRVNQGQPSPKSKPGLARSKSKPGEARSKSKTGETRSKSKTGETRSKSKTGETRSRSKSADARSKSMPGETESSSNLGQPQPGSKHKLRNARAQDQNGELETEGADGNCGAAASATHFMNDALMSLIVKFHNTVPKHCSVQDPAVENQEFAFDTDQLSGDDVVQANLDAIEAFLANYATYDWQQLANQQ